MKGMLTPELAVNMLFKDYCCSQSGSRRNFVAVAFVVRLNGRVSATQNTTVRVVGYACNLFLNFLISFPCPVSSMEDSFRITFLSCNQRGRKKSILKAVYSQQDSWLVLVFNFSV